MPWNAPWQREGHCPWLQHAWDLLTMSHSGPSDPPRMIPPLGAGRGQAGDEQGTTGCCACRAGAGAQCWLLVPRTHPELPAEKPGGHQLLPNLCRATQGDGSEALALVPLAWKDPGAPWKAGVAGGSVQRASHSHSRTEGRGRGIPGWQAGGQGGRRHNNGGGEVWRRRVVRVCGDTPAAPAAPAPPATKRTASLQRPLRSCPRWHRHRQHGGTAPPARGHPAAALGPRVMGYLGVGLLSLPLQEPELLLLLSEEVP